MKKLLLILSLCGCATVRPISFIDDSEQDGVMWVCLYNDEKDPGHKRLLCMSVAHFVEKFGSLSPGRSKGVTTEL